MVSGTKLYTVEVEIGVAAPSRWTSICRECAGAIDSLIELLQVASRRLSWIAYAANGVGLFPSPHEIRLSCSCPDWATMCKHVAAVLYGVGTRLDFVPDLLFTLRGVDRAELVSIGADLPLARTAAASERVLADDDVAALFGIEIAAPDASPLGQSREEKRQARGPAAAAGPAHPKKPGGRRPRPEPVGRRRRRLGASQNAQRRRLRERSATAEARSAPVALFEPRRIGEPPHSRRILAFLRVRPFFAFEAVFASSDAEKIFLFRWLSK